MREKFNETTAVSLMLAKKHVDNKFLLTEGKDKKKVHDVRQSEEILKRSGSKKTNKNYRIVRIYGILTVNDRRSW